MASNEPFKLLLDGRLFLTSIDKMTQPNIRDYCLERCSLSHDLLGKKKIIFKCVIFFKFPPHKIEKRNVRVLGFGLYLFFF